MVESACKIAKANDPRKVEFQVTESETQRFRKIGRILILESNALDARVQKILEGCLVDRVQIATNVIGQIGAIPFVQALSAAINAKLLRRVEPESGELGLVLLSYRLIEYEESSCRKNKKPSIIVRPYRL
jgi:hypothetical protein